ncbi:2-amino-4-hydroxy-6-hydroxymethyldihydropteridine diphosphokinase [Thermosulfidibacter takaii ABI70S6]|uniref:2-amino-4-hydroxy-6-hydroxymethyldihydropteridine pyrophosphokinase n=1 Tax=Thermosulfidibacter takaii (strain DSM 17441 / JCM 13301 / NBRC 103674 / ABI70S6) TaxID=1298851 RepID=A0A0S3QW67_THET7|nr:2-amino-4-hydroxy-6-hydroxymethyldihydropteridine diphosphokinase [Thermosulfidibacter takaii]BAT72568.1 2-amino-4-hydroxy-6-hydroxymethyldihydropteridine diphosphokinase [Thermosulfidibacter takaii ABI70S6]
MARFVLGFGSNLGSRIFNIFRALQIFSKTMFIKKLSGVYLTEPVGPPQGWFVNVSALVDFEGDPPTLLRLCKRVEALVGRETTYRWGPRILDVDIIWWEGGPFEREDLIIPHPQWANRRFVLVTLTDLGILEIGGLGVKEALSKVLKQRVIPIRSAKVVLEDFLNMG